MTEINAFRLEKSKISSIILVGSFFLITLTEILWCLNEILYAESVSVWESSTASTSADPQLNQIYCSPNLSLSQFNSPLYPSFPSAPPHPPLGFPDTPCHRPVFYGTGLGAAVLVKLHPEDASGHGHVEPLLFLRLCLHLPVDLSPVSLHDRSPDFLHTYCSFFPLAHLYTPGLLHPPFCFSLPVSALLTLFIGRMLFCKV